MKVFWSWQSDTQGRIGRHFVRKSLEDAVYATEELEETAKLFLMLRDQKTTPLTAEQVAELQRKFPNPI